MRGSKVKALRTTDRPNPGRKGGGAGKPKVTGRPLNDRGGMGRWYTKNEKGRTG
jgi:hypothetical protein